MSTAPVMLLQFKITEYEMTGMGLMKYSLGIHVQQSKGKIFISRKKVSRGFAEVISNE
jgi:hypothetical protein